MIIKDLDWDSTFFNKNVGELEIDNAQKFISEIKVADYQKYDLLYVKMVEDKSLELHGFIQTYSETKLVFSKKIALVKDRENDEIYSIFDVNFNVSEIYQLAYESGKQSRFSLDPKIKQIEFKYLYNLWVDNSINGKFADGILVYKDQNSILGFVTYKTNQDVATIGLIAVNPKYQGRGIGRKLIQSLENKLAIIGVATVKIPTQLQNEMACGFYTKMGYQLIDSTILKHFWKL
jgi:dTDP-4-amino-4,6-dideoxy-D-galactose acyltransferase